MEGIALEAFDTLDPSQLRLGHGAVGANHEFGFHVVATVGLNTPEFFVLQPGGVGHSGLEQGEIVQVVALGNRLAVVVDFRRFSVAVFWHVIHFVQQRQVIVRHHIAGRARVTVPVPGATHIGSTLDDANTLHTYLAQLRRRQQRRKAAANKQHFNGIRHSLARLDVTVIGIFTIVGEITLKVGIKLPGTFRTVGQTQIPLFSEFVFDGVVIFLGMFLPGFQWIKRTQLSHAIRFADLFVFSHELNPRKP